MLTFLFYCIRRKLYIFYDVWCNYASASSYFGCKLIEPQRYFGIFPKQGTYFDISQSLYSIIPARKVCASFIDLFYKHNLQWENIRVGQSRLPNTGAVTRKLQGEQIKNISTNNTFIVSQRICCAFFQFTYHTFWDSRRGQRQIPWWWPILEWPFVKSPFTNFSIGQFTLKDYYCRILYASRIRGTVTYLLYALRTKQFCIEKRYIEEILQFGILIPWVNNHIHKWNGW